MATPSRSALEIEHPRTLADSEIKVSVSSGVHEEADIPSGRRIRVTLPVGDGLVVEVLEQQVEESRFSLSASWLVGNVVGLEEPRPEGTGVCRSASISTG